MIKRYLLFVILLAVCGLATAGCSKEEDSSTSGIKIYRAHASFDTLVWEYRDELEKEYGLTGVTIPGNVGLSDEELRASKIDEMLRLLSSAPVTKGCFKLIPDGVTVNSWSFGQDGQLIMDFNSAYNNMDVPGELLCRAGIVKSLCQIEGVEYVEFQIEGKPLALSNGNIVRLMTAQDFIDNTGTDTKFAQIVNITVYFADADGTEMSESLLRVEYDGQRTLEEIVLYELIEGPLEAQTDLYPIMPEGTVVNKVSSKDGICYVDFNDKFLAGREGVSSEITIYGVVNSLVEISYITKVYISIDGTPLKNYGGLAVNGALGRRPELITIEKAGDITE